jgi:hypothetical protein
MQIPSSLFVALLTRAVAESAAMVWYLLEILEQRSNYTPGSLYDPAFW